MKKQTGIWLDLRNAWIINLPTDDDSGTEVLQIRSAIEEASTIGGGRGSKKTFLHHGGANHTAAEERRHHEEKNYFADILKHLDPATDELVIFGPSEAKLGLRNLIASQHQGPSLVSVEAADQMTEHQMEAFVRKFFGREAVRKKPKFGQIHQ